MNSSMLEQFKHFFFYSSGVVGRRITKPRDLLEDLKICLSSGSSVCGDFIKATPLPKAFRIVGLT
jgi:hypothetical protein